MKTCERTRVKKYKGVVVILCSCVRLEQFMNEKFIEQKLVEAVKKAGLMVFPIVSSSSLLDILDLSN